MKEGKILFDIKKFVKPRELDMVNGPLASSVLFFTLPLIASNLLQVLFNMADIAVVGQFSGPKALGSVGSTAILVALFTGFLIGIGGGVNVLTALFIGSGNEKEAGETVHTSLVISVMMGILALCVGVFASPWILSLMHTKEELMDGAVLYLRIYSLGMPALAVYNYGNAVFSAAGNTKKPLRYLTIAGIINVILNLFLVVGCKRSVDGVAMASVISQYISAILILRAMFRSKEIYGLRWRKIRIHRDKAVRVLALGIPTGIQNMIFQIANLFVQAGINSFPAVVVEGNSAATNADALVYDVMMAFYTACSSFMGQNLGAGRKKRVRDSYLISLFYSYGAGLILGLSLVLFGRGFLGIFTRDVEVINAGMYRLTIMGLSYAVSAFMDCTIAASRALGKSVGPTLIVIMGSCVFRVLWIYTIFAYFHTITSLYLLYVFSWSITAVAEIIYFVRVYRRTTAGM
ncbi:MAG: MATE family efflux transporter [Lachnospiraceae bacterium]